MSRPKEDSFKNRQRLLFEADFYNMDTSVLKNLDPEQRKAVTYGSGPLLIVAGAGTGKTTVITHRIVYLIKNKKIEPQEVLALTFTDKAAGEMEERIDKLLPFGYLDLWVSTFHSFCERILKEYALEIGLSPDFKLLDQTEGWLLVRRNLDKFNLDYYRPLGNPTKFIYALIEHFSRCKDEGVYPQDYLHYSDSLKLNLDDIPIGSKAIESRDKSRLAALQQEADRIKEVANAYHTYQRILLENNSLDFGDLIYYTLKLFKERPLVLEKFREQFKYILVDEFQDTNWIQYELVKLLAAPKNNLTVCADDDQCLPGSTKVDVFKEETIKRKKIKDIKRGDEVLTAVGKGHMGVSSVNKVFKRKKHAKLLTIQTKNGFNLTVTDNHKMFCLIPRTYRGKYHYVYLMYRQGLGWRMGVTDDLIRRLRFERSADKILAIKAFDTDREARYYETLWSLKYGIPTSCFQTRKGIVIKKNLLKKLYDEIDVGKNIQRLAQELNIDLGSPHFCLNAVNRGQKVRIKINLQMCYRRYRSKHHVKDGKALLLNPWIRHRITLETSDANTIKELQKVGFKLARVKKGMKLVIESDDLRKLGLLAKKLQQITGGFIEPKFNVAVKYDRPVSNQRNFMASVMPAKNLVLGHYLPVKKGNEIIYDQIVDIKEKSKETTVYDLEINQTHNFIANGVVVHNSIFQWRGASFNNVLQFRKDFPQAREIVLMHNYRACQNILDLSYKFIQLNNPNRLEYQLNQVTEISRKAKQKGVDLKNFKRISKKLKATKKGEGIIEHLHFKTLDQEINGVISKIIELLKKDKKTTFNDFAILVRANRTAEPFCRALERTGIPYQFLASHGLYSKPIILDIISYFKLLDDYHESSAIYRLLNLPFFEIPYEDITKISKFAHRKAQSIYQTLGQLPLVGVSSKTAEAVSHILGLIQKHTAIVREKNVSEVFVAFLKDSGYLDYLTKKQSAEIRQELDLINQFYDKIKQFESSHLECRLSNFMEQIGLELESGEEGPLRFDPEQGPESIKIMTLHSAKGLEFKYIFLVNLVGRHFPTTKKREPIQVPESLIKEVTPEGNVHLQEERRLFYVGMTRAKKGLFFTSAEDYGGKRKKKLSRFLVELGFSDFQNKRAKPTTLFQGLESQTLLAKKKQEDMSRYLPDHFSFTQLAAFGKCPLQYKFAHILKVPVRGRAPFSFGKTMHNTLEQWVRRVVFAKAKVQETLLPGFGASDLKQESLHQSLQQGTGQAKTGFKEMLEIYEKEWRDDWYESEKQKQDYYKLGEKSLKAFYDNFMKLSPKIKIIQNKLALELNFNIKIKEHTLLGKIDRIDELKDGTCEIIDYKTGGSKKKLKPEDKEQLLIYQIAAEEVLGIKPSRLSYHYLEDGSKFSFLGTDREKRRLKKKIIEDIEKIRNSDFIATPGWQCKYCDFRDICEYRSI